MEGAHSTQIPSKSRGFEPRPSTSSGTSSTQLPRATKNSKPKRKSEPVPRKPDPAPRKRAKAARPVPPLPIRNASPDDAVRFPDIILDLDDNERFDDSDVEFLSRCSSSSSQALQVLPSPTYCLNATSDVTTERLTPKISPGS